MLVVLTVIAIWPYFVASTARGQAEAETAAAEAGPTRSSDYDAVLDRAVQAFDAQDYTRARALFEEAYALRPNARVLRGLGISALHLERFSTSKRELSEALRDTKQPLTPSQRDGVKDLLEWMQDNLGTLRLQVRPPGALITLNDDAIDESELIVQPGRHRVRASAEGYAPEERKVEIAAGQQKTLQLKLSRQAEDRVAESLRPAPEVTAADASAADAGREPGPLAHPAHPAPTGPIRDASSSSSSSVLERWWFWTAVGVVVAGGVATTLALTAGSSEPAYEPGGLGGVIMPLERRP